MPAEVVGGILSFEVNAVKYRAKGTWTYNLGEPVRTAIVGADGVHGFKEEPQVPFIEGAITDGRSMKILDLLRSEDITGTLHLRNGKVIVIRGAWSAGENTVDTEESEVAVRFEGMGAVEVRP
jgi:hypothetical protein